MPGSQGAGRGGGDTSGNCAQKKMTALKPNRVRLFIPDNFLVDVRQVIGYQENLSRWNLPQKFGPRLVFSACCSFISGISFAMFS